MEIVRVDLEREREIWRWAIERKGSGDLEREEDWEWGPSGRLKVEIFIEKVTRIGELEGGRD